MNQDNLLNIFTKPVPQTILMFCTSLILFFLTLAPLKKFNNYDPPPSINLIDEIKKNSKDILPIKTGFYFRNFIDFDIQKNDFTVEAIVWFILESSNVKIEDLGRFNFSKGDIIKISSPITIDLDKNKKLIQYDIRLRFSSNLNYRLFPLDSHRLYLTLNNRYLDADKFYFDIDNDKFNISQTLYTFGWKNIGKNLKTGYSTIVLDKNDDRKNTKFPRIIFSLDFLGTSMRNILLIFMPLFIVFFLALFSFSFDPNKYRGTIMSISAAVVPAILGYRFVIESVAPKVTYFMLSDQIFNLFLLLSFLIFLVDTFYIEKLKYYRGAILLTFHILLIISWVYILYFWAK